MKNRVLGIFIALTLIFSTMCGNLIAFADTSEGESKYLDDKTYHHLDMGVTVAIGHDGKFDNNLTYGTMRELESPIPITFGNKIEITGCHWFNPNGIDNGTEPFIFSKNDGDSWNIDVSTPEAGRERQKILEDRKDKYHTVFDELVTTEIKDRPTAVVKEYKGNETVVNLSYSRKIETAPYKINIASFYKNEQTRSMAYKYAYLGWGGETGLAEQAKYDAGADTIYKALKTLFATAPENVSDTYEIDMVFVPIVIEYKILKPELVECSRCHKYLAASVYVC